MLEATTEEAEATAEGAALAACDTALSMLCAALNSRRQSSQTFAEDAVRQSMLCSNDIPGGAPVSVV